MSGCRVAPDEGYPGPGDGKVEQDFGAPQGGRCSGLTGRVIWGVGFRLWYQGGPFPTATPTLGAREAPPP